MPQLRISVNDSACSVMVHIGKKIKEILESQERTPAWLAKKINCERTNVYYIFKQSSINTDLLLKISVALHHNFFNYYTEEFIISDLSNIFTEA